MLLWKATLQNLSNFVLQSLCKLRKWNRPFRPLNNNSIFNFSNAIFTTMLKGGVCVWVQVATRPHKQSNKSNLGSQSEIYTFFTQPWDWRCQKCRSKVWVNWLGTSQNAIYQNQIKCVTFLHSVIVQSLFWTFPTRVLFFETV